MMKRGMGFRSYRAGVVSLVGIVAALAPAGAVGAQSRVDNGASGRIVGKVVSAETGEPLVSAQVVIDSLDLSVATTVDGRFVLMGVPEGIHALTVRLLGYAQKTVTEVVVSSGNVTQIDITMESRALEVSGITISANAQRSSNAFLLNQRRLSSALVESIGQQDIARLPDSDAAEVARRLTGVTIQDGQFAYIRGMGERYSQTALNGAALPSPEPDKEAVPLDLIPSGFVESLTTVKSFTPDRWADFSGGAVEIETRDFPSRLTWSLNVGTSFNTKSQFKDDFLTYPGGDLDFTGFDDGTRDLPDIFDRELGGLDGARLPNSDATLLREIGLALPTTFTPSRTTTPLNRSTSLSVGASTELFGRELGFILSGTYSDSYVVREEEERKFRASSFDPSIPAEVRTPNVDYAFERGTRTVSWGAIANTTYRFADAHKLAFRGTLTVNTDDEARTYQGENREDLGGFVKSDRLRFVSRTLAWGQLAGEHLLAADLRLDWSVTGARASRDEPGLREALYLGDNADGPLFLENVGESGRYFYGELIDDDLTGEIDLTLPVQLFGGQGNLRVGGAYRWRNRDFASRRLNWSFLSGEITNLDEALETGTVVGTPPGSGQFRITDVIEPGDQYDAEDERAAAYGMVDIPLHDRVRLVGGARVETYDLLLTARGDALADRDQTDWAPSASVIVALSDRMNLRFAGSRTVDRPELRELAPFQFTEATSLRQLEGNPDLESATILNADIRWDWFPEPGEVLSAGVFYKQIDEPIEQVYFAAASSAFSYQNADEADLVGFELETRLGLGRLSERLEDFGAQANFSFIDSEVSVRSSGAFQPTNLRRPLEGQAEYVFNAGTFYTAPGNAFEAGLFFNRTGERLEAAGGSGIPDIVEQPRSTLDATLKLRLRASLNLTLRGENLLNSPFVFEQSANGVTRTQRTYETGQTFSIGLGWTRN